MNNQIVDKRKIRWWRKNFLNARGLDKPSGEALYTYKMTRKEFDEMEKVFNEWLSYNLKYFSVSNLVSREPIFNELFVLYASEWWKRKYKGGHWSWQPIVNDLGINSEDWSAPKRSECVEKGFKSWRISLSSKAGKRFLGSIAIQGGLPMALLANNQGSVSRVLHRVVDLLSGKEPDHDLLISWIQNLSHYLPKTYQRDEIYDLLAEVIIVISRIKAEAPSNKAEDVLDEWRSNSELWKKKFPISISDDKTYDIIEHLVKKVAQAKPQKHKKLVSLNRYFDFFGVEEEKLRIEIDFEKTIDEEALKNSFNIGKNVELDSQLIIEVKNDSNDEEIYLRKLIGENRYKLEQTTVDYIGKDVISEFKFVLRDRQGNKWINKNINGEKLEADLPWIFSYDEEEEKAVFVSQGSSKISGKSYIVVLKTNFKFSSNGPPKQLGTLFQDYDIYKFNENARFTNILGEEFKVTNKQAGGLDLQILISGNEIENIFKSPSRGFRGRPNIFETSDNGRKKVPTNFYWKKGDFYLSSQSDVLLGPVTAVKKEGNYIQWKKKMVIIPHDSSEEIIRGKDAKSGYWNFKNWDLEVIKSLHPDVTATKKENDLWYFEYLGNGIVPESIEANMVWKGNATPAKVNLQFPGQGVRAFDKYENEIKKDSLHSLNNLYGKRINILPGNCSLIQIELFNKSKTSSHLIDLDFSEDEYLKEIRLIDFREIFENMLSLSKDNNDLIILRINFDGRPIFSINVARYSFSLNEIDSRWYLPEEILENLEDDESNLSIKTQRMDVPGIEDFTVYVNESGNLVFPENALNEGPWIIYPSKDSDLMMRPIYHFAESTKESEDLKGLRRAINEENEEVRNELIDDALTNLTKDPNHEDWNVVAQFANEYGHLPLNTLDLWKRAIYNYDFMAMLITGRVNLPNGFADRFSLELPFMFEFIPLESFQKAIKWEKLILEGIFKDQKLDDKEMYDLIKRKCSVSEWMVESFKYCYLLALNKCVGLYDSNIRVGNLDIVNSQLYEDSDSHYQRLRRRHELKRHEWPNEQDIYNLISNYKDSDENLFFFNQQYRTVVINTPIMLALWSYKGLEHEQLKMTNFVQMIRNIKNFDESWFINAFNLSLLRLYYLEQQ